MLKITTTLALCLALGGTAFAQTPPEVLKAYKSYNTAMAQNDFKSALKHGKAAWKAAESIMGESKTTGDLAFNYGFLAKSRGLTKDAVPALERAADLSSLTGDKAAEVKLERTVELIAAYESLGEHSDVKKTADAALEAAEKANLGQTVFAGEILVHRALNCSRTANRAARRLVGKPTSTRLAVNSAKDEHTSSIQQRCSRDAESASKIFAANPKMSRPKYVALAANQVGYAYERDDDWVNAIMSYQTAREAVETVYGRDNDFVMGAIGRWVHARAQLDFAGDLDKAKSAGLCDCWPYDVNTEKVAVVKSVKADLPRNAVEIKSSGSVILKADVSDTGATENVRVVHSWPAGEYDKTAIKAFSQYQYAPKTGYEPEGYRKDVVDVFNFIIYNESTNETY